MPGTGTCKIKKIRGISTKTQKNEIHLRAKSIKKKMNLIFWPHIFKIVHVPVPGMLELRNFACRLVLGSNTHRTFAKKKC